MKTKELLELLENSEYVDVHSNCIHNYGKNTLNGWEGVRNYAPVIKISTLIAKIRQRLKDGYPVCIIDKNQNKIFIK